MKIAADTNVLLRVFVDDDPAQSRLATETLDEAELVAIGLQTLCELVWVLYRSYGTSRGDIAEAIQRLLETDKIVTIGRQWKLAWWSLKLAETSLMALLPSKAAGLAEILL